ncbi:Calx-beta domain-containing protein [Okeania sp.]|uniref:beta strand repeat-containing protein n=1 Tax=Okeania sp. TaxID=3100323 RepID=UPI002B4B8E04|nr:Calx-beta domain-containing protein [Okeania sp.]MEB3343809.1 Calx-beta domain-containing protein [Okeania sp.]
MVTRQTININPDIELILAEVPNETLDGGAGIDILQGVVNGQDTFVLEGDGTLPTFGEVVPSSSVSTQTIPGVIVLDFNVNEDTALSTTPIGLGGPLDPGELNGVSDLELPIASFYNLFGPSGTPLSLAIASAEQLGIRTENIDPDNDGILEGALITDFSNNTPIGYFLNVTSSDLEAALLRPEITIEALNSNITEGGEPGQFYVSTDPFSLTVNDIVVNYSVGGTSTNGEDYEEIPLSVTLPVPVGTITAATIDINAIADEIFESVETVELTLQPSGDNSYTVGLDNTATITINDPIPGPPVVIIETPTSEITEGGEVGQFEFTIDSPQDNDIVVNYVVGGTSTNEDYIIPSSVTIPAGETDAVINITAIADEIVDSGETVSLTLQPDENSSYTVGETNNTATISINDIPTTEENPNVGLVPQITIDAPTPNIIEGEIAQFILSIDSPQSNEIAVNYTIDGTATNLDYQEITAPVIVIPAEETSVPINISAFIDQDADSGETVNLTIEPSADNSYTVGGVSSATITINDAPPVAEILTATLNTPAGDGGLKVSVDAYGSFGQNVGGSTSDAFYDPIGDVGVAGTMFESGVAFRLTGETTRTFLTTGSIDDQNAESAEGLNNPGFLQANAANADSTFTIGDLNFSLNQTVDELLAGTERRGSTLVQTYTITNIGTETASFDLTRYADGDLFFDGTLADTGGRLFIDGQEILFETDSGENPQTATTFVGITAVGGNSAPPGRAEVNIFSGLVNDIINGVPLDDVITGDGPDADEFIEIPPYDVALALGNNFVLAPGESTQYVTSTIFGSGAPADIFNPNPNPSVKVNVNTLTPNITEGAEPGQFIFNIDSNQSSDIVVNYSLGGTSTNGSDYEAIPLNVTIPAGSTNAVVNINALDDRIVEPLETVELTIQPSNNNGYTVSEANTATINIEDIREVGFNDIQNLQDYSIDSLTGVTLENADGIVSFQQGGNGNFIDALVGPAQGNAITYSEGDGIIMNVPGGFSGGLSFRYASPFVNHRVTVYDSPNGTGNILNDVTLAQTPESSEDFGTYILTEQEQIINFNGVAQSVSFGSEPNKLILDDIRLFG